MDYRGIDKFTTNFGFRLQYNRLFKPEYLPARVRYNQFFFLMILGSWYAYNRTSVSDLL